jgi:hypothetical protein
MVSGSMVNDDWRFYGHGVEQFTHVFVVERDAAPGPIAL